MSDTIVSIQQSIKRQVDALGGRSPHSRDFDKLRAAFPQVSPHTLKALMYAAEFKYARAYNSLVILECRGVIDDVGDFILEEQHLQRLDEGLKAHFQECYDNARRAMREEQSAPAQKLQGEMPTAANGGMMSFKGLISTFANKLEEFSLPQKEQPAVTQKTERNKMKQGLDSQGKGRVEQTVVPQKSERGKMNQGFDSQNKQKVGPEGSARGTATMRSGHLDKKSTIRSMSKKGRVTSGKLSSLFQPAAQKEAPNAHDDGMASREKVEVARSDSLNCSKIETTQKQAQGGLSEQTAAKGEESKDHMDQLSSMRKTPHEPSSFTQTQQMKERESNSIRSVKNTKENITNDTEHIAYIGQQKFLQNINPPPVLADGAGLQAPLVNRTGRSRLTETDRPASLPPKPRASNSRRRDYYQS